MKAPVVCLLFAILLAIVSLRGIDGAYVFKRTRSSRSYTQEEALEAMRTVFDGMDKNNDGYLDIEELRATLGQDKPPISPEEMFAASDDNGDGKISFEEVLSGLDRIQREDIYGSGKSTEQQPSTVPTASSGQSHPTSSSAEEEDLQVKREYFNRLDTNGDGYLNMEEFRGPMVDGVTPSAEDVTPSADKLFHVLDVNEDGKISFEEIHQGLKALKDATTQEGIGETTQFTTSTIQD